MCAYYGLLWIKIQLDAIKENLHHIDFSQKKTSPATTNFVSAFLGADPENSKSGGRDTCPLASFIDDFYFVENSIRIIQNFKEKGVSRPPRPIPKSALDWSPIISIDRELTETALQKNQLDG